MLFSEQYIWPKDTKSQSYTKSPTYIWRKESKHKSKEKFHNLIYTSVFYLKLIFALVVESTRIKHMRDKQSIRKSIIDRLYMIVINYYHTNTTQSCFENNGTKFNCIKMIQYKGKSR